MQTRIVGVFLHCWLCGVKAMLHCKLCEFVLLKPYASFANPHRFDADPDPPFHIDNANSDLNPTSYKSDANLRPLACRPWTTPFLSSQASIVSVRGLHGFLFGIYSSWILTTMRKWIRLFTLMRIRIHLHKMKWIRIRNIACRTVNAPKIYTFPTEITPWCLELSFIECLQRTKLGSYFTYFMYAALYSLEGSERFTSFCAHPCVCTVWCMGVSGVCLCVPVLASFAWGEEGRGGGQEEGGHQCVNVLRRRVAILHSLFRNGFAWQGKNLSWF